MMRKCDIWAGGLGAGKALCKALRELARTTKKHARFLTLIPYVKALREFLKEENLERAATFELMWLKATFWESCGNKLDLSRGCKAIIEHGLATNCFFSSSFLREGAG